MKILILGLPGSGKTTLARELAYHFLIPHHNADTSREMWTDWDFSYEGRKRQAIRMSKEWGILDFVCPVGEFREIVDAESKEILTKANYDNLDNLLISLMIITLVIPKALWRRSVWPLNFEPAFWIASLLIGPVTNFEALPCFISSIEWCK